MEIFSTRKRVKHKKCIYFSHFLFILFFSSSCFFCNSNCKLLFSKFIHIFTMSWMNGFGKWKVSDCLWQFYTYMSYYGFFKYFLVVYDILQLMLRYILWNHTVLVSYTHDANEWHLHQLPTSHH